MCVYYRPGIIACHAFYCDVSGRLVILLSINWLKKNCFRFWSGHGPGTHCMGSHDTFSDLLVHSVRKYLLPIAFPSSPSTHSASRYWQVSVCITITWQSCWTPVSRTWPNPSYRGRRPRWWLSRWQILYVLCCKCPIAGCKSAHSDIVVSLWCRQLV